MSDMNETNPDPTPREALAGSDAATLRALAERVADVAQKTGEQALRLQLRPHSTHALQERPDAAYTADNSDMILKHLRDEVRRIAPLDGFWEDNAAARAPGRRYWALCPLDGVINYARNMSEWTITIAVFEVGQDGEAAPILGVVHAPALGLTYMAGRGAGALRIRRAPGGAEKREQVIPSTAQELDGSVICFGMSYFPAESQLALAKAAQIAGKPADIKRIGPASLDLCKVADGTYDAYFEPRLHSWDVAAVAAATVVIWQAQGTVERWDGQKVRWDSGNDILATNGGLRDDLLPYLQS